MRTKRVKDLIPWREVVAESVQRVRLLEPLPGKEFPVSQNALVIGGGLAGIETALRLAELGIETFLVEKEPQLGGRLRQLPAVCGLENNPLDFISERIERINSESLIKVITSAQIAEVKGQVGNFRVGIQKGEEKTPLVVGAIVVATGYSVAKAYDQFGLQPSDNIITQTDLDNRLNLKGKVQKEVFSIGGKVPKVIAFVLGTSSKASKLPSISALTGGLVLKQRLNAEIYVLNDGMRIAGSGLETLYRTARKEGIVFLRYSKKPEFLRTDTKVNISIEDLQKRFNLPCDLLIIEDKIVPPDSTKELADILKISLDRSGFYQEDNINLMPIESNRKGIFLVGSCHNDCDFPETLSEVGDCAGRIYGLLHQGKITASELVVIDPGKCALCLTCQRSCPHSAIEVSYYEKETKSAARVIEPACQGCGVCVAECPARAIAYKNCSNEQISQILAGVSS